MFLAPTLTAELVRWSGSEEIVNAPVAESRLGAQPDGGVPGVLVDGCVWEVRGPTGGHLGVVVERFEGVNMDRLAMMAAEGSVSSTSLADGGRRWDVPASDDSPSGAVIVGDGAQLVVVRTESHSDDPDRTFLSQVLDVTDRFFRAVGDAAESSRAQ